MPFRSIKLAPGVDTAKTPALNAAGWSGSNLIRFREGLPEKTGGWVALSSTPMIGATRGMKAWADLNGIPYLALGSEQRLAILQSSTLYDITPVRQTFNASPAVSAAGTTTVTLPITGHGAVTGDTVNVIIPLSISGVTLFGFYQVTVIDPNTVTIQASSAVATSTTAVLPQFTTTSGSIAVEVTFPNHGVASGSLYTVYVATLLGGITLQGQYLVTSVVDPGHFWIQVPLAATSNASGYENTGLEQYQFLLPTGPASSSVSPATSQSAWGLGGYGMSAFGMGGPGGATTLAQVWHLDNYGQLLVGAPTGGALYQWQGPVAQGNVATPVSGAPTQITSLFVANQQQQVVALGTNIGTTTTFDPMLVRWCDSGNLPVWTATVTNMAGSFRLNNGSRLVGGIAAPSQNYIWSDTSIFAMNWLGATTTESFIWGFTVIASGCGLIASRAAGVAGANVVWMSQREFMFADGAGVHTLMCPVWDQVFPNLNTLQAEKITCAVNSAFNEVAWYYPSNSGNGEVDSYVKVKLPSGQWGATGPDLATVWDYGTLDRLSWCDQSVLGLPIGVDSNGLVMQHEVSPDANGAPLDWWIESGYATLDDGENFTFIDQLIPDFKATPGAQIQVTVYSKNLPDDTPAIQGPYTVSPGSPLINLRLRGRMIAFKFEGNDLGSSVRIGAVRYKGQPDGKR